MHVNGTKLLVVGMTFVMALPRPGFAQITGGAEVPIGQLEAVGTVPGCTATLITNTLVLTAAHCVCTGKSSPTGCVTRTTFRFKDVFRIDDPTTPIDEAATRQVVPVPGEVAVHPDYTVGGWLWNDFALVRLDTPADELVIVEPIPVERPERLPRVGDDFTLVGFGRTESMCASSGEGIKRQVTVELVEIVGGPKLRFLEPGRHTCKGDSGGPALNADGNIVGVASSGDFSASSGYAPTYVAYEWIFGTNTIRQTRGQVSLLRIHRVGAGYGPATDPLDGEVVVKLTGSPERAFGFRLRGDDATAHRGMLQVLRDAFNGRLEVLIDYRMTGPQNAKLLRVRLLGRGS